MRPRWTKQIVVAACVVLLAALACNQTDILARARVKADGYITGPALDDSNDVGPRADVIASFPRDPGTNTLDELLTKSDRYGHYAFSVDVNKGWCEPLYFFQYGYYEQNRLICDSPHHQKHNVTLISAYDSGSTHDCQTLCQRFHECAEFFKITYTDTDQCEAHCAEGCSSSSYLSCAYNYDEAGLNRADKCDELWGCYGSYCDADWFNSDDDTGD